MTIAYHHGDLRNALIEAAVGYVDEHKAFDFSLSKLARELNVTPAAAYKHFADKDALIEEIAGRGFRELASIFEATAAKLAPTKSASQAISRLQGIGQAYYDFGQDHPGVFQLMFGLAGAAHRAKAMASGTQAGAFDYLVRSLNDLHRLKLIAVRPNQHHTWLAWCLIHGATMLAISQASKPTSPRRVGRQVTEAIIRQLSTQ